MKNKKNEVGQFKFKKFQFHIDKVLKANGINDFLSNQEELKSKSDPFIVSLLDFLYRQEIKPNIIKTFSPKELCGALPDEVFLDVAQKSDRPAWLGKRLSRYIDTTIGKDPSYLVKKYMKGKNPYYHFSLDEGGYGGTKEEYSSETSNSNENSNKGSKE